MPGRRSALRGLPAVVAAVALVALAGCSGKSADPVAVGAVTRSTVTEVVEAPATIAARRTATVSSPATGKVATLYVADGDQVSAGELLLRIDSPSARRALSEAQRANAQASSSTPAAPKADISASVKRSDRAAKQAFAQASTAIKALPQGVARTAAQAQLAAAKAQYAAARATVNRAVDQINAGVGSTTDAVAALSRAQQVQTQAAVDAAARTVAALDVRAPISGAVSLGADAAGSSGSGSSSSLSSLIDQLPSSQQGAATSLLGGSSDGSSTVTGELARGVPVTSGEPLLTVTDVSRLSLTAQVDETDVLLVRTGVPADVELAAVPGARYAAVVTAVGLKPTTSARGGVSYSVRLALGKGVQADGRPAPKPRPGMSAVARLRVLTASGAATVPAAAVFQDGARSAVWLVKDGAATRREVRLGAQGEASYQILSGVKVGDTVVVRGADQVREGQRVG